MRSVALAMTLLNMGFLSIELTLINMSMTVDGKNYPLRMPCRKINDDTLQLDRQNYRRVVQ
jgi:hypothetical protein